MSEEIIIPGQQTDLSIPDYMQGVTDTDISRLQRYFVPPLAKIVQGQSRMELKQQFGESTVVAMSAGSSVGIIAQPIAKGEKESAWTRFIPLFAYAEFIAWNPMQTGLADLYAVRERTLDPNSPLAAKCLNKNKNVREYPCPEFPAKNVRCCEHINFVVCFLDNPELMEMPVLMSFSRSNHAVGRSISNQITSRPKLPSWGRIFEFNVSPRSKDGNDWYGFNARPATNESGMTAVASKEWFEYTDAKHKELLELYTQGLMQAQYDEEDDPKDTTPHNHSDAQKF